ncbi:MAG: diacylglycerol kinase family lipid kinase [Clostridiales bacterium]|nr:diacylglycerol kinase family lipid kinase [Clostridiales bacterium]
MRPYFIVNPVACGGKALEKFAELRKILEERGADYTFVMTEKAGESAPLAEAAYKSGERYIVAVGGDGTVSEIAGALGGKEDAVMGICPFGTGNDFASALLLSPDPVKTAETILNGSPKPVDLGYAGGRAFVNVLGLGFDVDVVINTERYKSKYHGMIPYLFGIARSMFHLSSTHLTITADGEVFEVDALLTAIANGRCFGGGMPVAPKADPSDGYFDVCIIKKISLFRFLTLLPLFLKGKHVGKKPVMYFKAKEVELSCGRTPLELDGELGEYAPAKVKIMESALRIMR